MDRHVNLIKYSLDPNCSKLSPLDQFPQFCSQGKIKPITKCSFHTHNQPQKYQMLSLLPKVKAY